MMRRTEVVILAVALCLTAACKKKAAVAPPSTPVETAPSKPVDRPQLAGVVRIDSFTAEPARVERGQAITLRWATTGADTVTIDQGVGNVPANGNRQLFPTATTTYAIIARAGNGSDTRTVTVEVVAPAVKPATTSGNTGPSVTEQINRLQSGLVDILFDYDMSDLRDDSRRAVNTDADILKQIFALDTRVTYVIEGHADERGSAEYNLGLADRRALVARDALVQLGVPSNRLRTISFGEEAPVCRDSNESCWQRNRRAHISPVQ